MFKKKLVVSLVVSFIAAASFVVFTNTQADSEINSRDKEDITFIDSHDKGDITSIDDRDKGDITFIHKAKLNV
ncbi:hypothetical protein ACTHP3_13750 [Shouchella rhizosphaerae]|uniref:hypothetical protein n=1 Tax=Shouchella rhizosphaerae TaxID=866786 RepID=UPI003F7F89E3